MAFCRKFYTLYPIVNAVCSQLNWTQYRDLIQIEDPDKREYYEQDARQKMTLPEDDSTILAGEYKLYIPSKEQLIAEVKQIQEEFENR